MKSMLIALICAVSFSMMSRASARTLDEAVTTICQKANSSIRIDELAQLFKQVKNGGQCVVLGARVFPSVTEAGSTAVDGYNGRVFLARLINDPGFPQNLSTETIRIRDKDLCAIREGDRVIVAYHINSQSAQAYRNKVLSFLHNMVFGEAGTIEAVIEFKDGDLQFVANQYLETKNMRLTVENFQCGVADFGAL